MLLYAADDGGGVVDAVFAVAVDSRLDVNVALNRPSYQTGVWQDPDNPPYSFSASFANDGNHGTHLHNSPCAHTDFATNPFWWVNLLVPLHVSGVKFTNRDALGMSAADLWFFWSVYSIVVARILSEVHFFP